MISPFAPIQEQINAFFPPAGHPYRRLNARIMDRLTPDATVLDIGCGRRAPMLREIAPGVGRAVGVDLVEFDIDDPNLEVFNTSVAAMPMLEGDTVDLAYSRSVMEHVEDPDAALREIHRVLKPGGAYVFLTPSRYDYASLLASVVPNRWHPRVVAWVSGRAEADVFPTYYRANSRAQLEELAERTGLAIRSFDYLGQYPAYLTFSRPLFWLGCHYERLLARFSALQPLRGWILCSMEKRT